MVDDDYAAAERLDICHVVTCQQDRGAEAMVICCDKATDATLHGHVEANGRLIKKEHSWTMQQGTGDLYLHTLTKREIADRLLDQRPEVE